GGRRRRKPGARGRGRGKRTKYLSLSDVLVKVEAGTPPPPPPPRSPEDEPAPDWEEEEEKVEVEVKQEDSEDGGGQPPQPQQQVEPFALHNEASTLFAALPAPSLSDILGASAGTTGGEDSPSPSPSASPEGGSGGTEEEDLARRALRGRERRWVYCSSGSSPTATTSSSSPCSSAASTGASAPSLLLKLDYDEILAAWADRASLYIGGGDGGEDSDAAPELELDSVLVEMEPSSEDAAGAPSPAADPVVAVAAFAWSAPGMAPAGERAEKVRRYKEKRRNRLFVKRIRYEVRRVNAVKRPRFKGRFIKEHEEIELQPT
ncbi:unnamed protein product, partial [Urochloa humidicola]